MTPYSLFHPLSALLRIGSILILAAAAGFASAGEGHDHGDAIAANASTASPRLHAHSDLFELVGIVNQGQMTVYLDRYATNEPVVGARIEFESGANRGVAPTQPDGTYLIKFDALGRPGELPFSFTVVAGSDSDLLAGDLALGATHDDGAAAAGRPWLRWLAYLLAAFLILGASILIFRKLATRRTRLSA